MATLKKYNLSGEESGEIAYDDAFLDGEVNHQMIKDYLVALRANQRQWSASTRGRSEVSHSTKKPHAQKGTGNARQGSLAAPQYRGGGIVFGPKPKFDQHIRINRKERRAATRFLLSEKIKSGALHLVEDAVFHGAMKKPKTKSVVTFLKKREVKGKKLLFIGGSALASGTKGTPFKKSVRNLQGTYYVLASNVNGYDLAAAQGIVISESALVELQKLLT